MNQKIKTAIFILLIFILMVPAIQQNTGLFKMKPLVGETVVAGYPRFSLKTWFDGSFQEKFNKATEERVGFRPLLIRSKNQLEYALFNKANASGVVVGKDRYVFESDYIRSLTGRDYLGEYYWKQKFDRLKLVSDTLAKLGVKLAIVLEPGKATYYPEKIPSRFIRFKSDQNNYQSILKESDQRHIPLLDLNRYFRDSKATAPFPLFPKGGIHWANGGMVFAADTLLEFIDKTMGLPVPDLVIDSVEMRHELRDTDGDVVGIMNLLIAPEHPDMGYPVFHLQEQDTFPRSRVLVISDSYYFNLMGPKIPARAFANEAFWYYNKYIYPDTWSAEKVTGSIDVPKTVESMNMVLLMVTERFYHRFDWDFTDNLYYHYFPSAPKEYRYDYIRSIMGDFNWFDGIQLQADYSGVPMQEKLIGNADYLFWVDDQAGKIPHDLGYYRVRVQQNPELMKQIHEKAGANNISVDEQVTLDARWLQEHQNQ